MISVAIVGTGNVGYHLWHKLAKSDDLHVTQFNSREPNSLQDFDIAIIAVSDDAISEVSQHIKSKLVVHTSGTASIGVLQNTTLKGVFYPLQSFSKEKKIDFTKVPLCIEAEGDRDLEVLKSIAQFLGSTSYRISSEQRKYLHLAAVFANNFTNHMYQMAHDICEEHKVPFDILLPLIEETSQKIQSLSPLEAQTGPAKRKDRETIKNHLNLLNDSQRELYKIITESIQKHGEKL